MFTKLLLNKDMDDAGNCQIYDNAKKFGTCLHVLRP